MRKYLPLLLVLVLCAFQASPLFPLVTIPQTGWTNSGVTLAGDGSMLFDGNDYLTTADSSLFAYNNGQPASWDFMVKLSQLPANQDKFVLWSQGSLSGQWMLIELYNLNGVMQLVIEGNNNPDYAALDSMDVGEWHYLSIRKTGASSYDMFQNCQQVSDTGAPPTLGDYSGSVQVGQFVNGGHRLKGYISYMDFQRANAPCTLPNQATPTPSRTPTITNTPTATNTPMPTFTPTPIYLSCPVGYHWTGIDARTVRCDRD